MCSCSAYKTSYLCQGSHSKSWSWRAIKISIASAALAHFFECFKSAGVMDIPLKYKQLWSKWDIRVLILLSLTIQIILIFLGRLRRNFSSRWIRMVLWGSYLLADWVADFVLGKLSSSIDDSSSSNVIIIAFWAPFLILHLGGPDTITAYSIEDNELWGRHLIGLGYELIVAFYVLFRSLPNTRLLAPTLLIFLVAIIKYAERSYSLYKASAEGFRKSIESSSILSPSYNKLQEQDLDIWTRAFHLYSIKKAIFIDAFPHDDPEIESKLYDMPTDESLDESLQMMKMELNFAYDEFYTKAIINHSRSGYVLRVFCSICILLAFFLFLLVPKSDFENIDVAISYVLLIGAIFLDIMATIMLVFSDWMVVNLLSVKKLRSCCELLAKYIIRIKKACHERAYWSIKIPQLNLFMSCIMISAPNKTSRESIMNRVAKKLSLVREKRLYLVSKTGGVVPYILQTMEPVYASKMILENISRYLRTHFNLTGWRGIARRDLVTLEKLTIEHSWSPQLFGANIELSLNLQVLVWHFTTEICCHLKPNFSPDFRSEFEISVYLSNYMMHTVVMRPDMLSVTWGSVPLRLHVFSEVVIDLVDLIHGSGDANVACYEIMNDSNLNPILMMLRGLVRHILHMTEEERWTLLAKAWTELLFLGAENSRANMHVKQSCRGDELLTFVWLFFKNRGY